MKTLENFDFDAWLATPEPGEPPPKIAKKSNAQSDIKRALIYFKVPWQKRTPAQIARDLWDALKNPSLSDRWAIRQDMYQLGVKAAKYYENRSFATKVKKLPYVEPKDPEVTFTLRTSRHITVTYIVKLVDSVVSYKVKGTPGEPWHSVVEELKFKDKKYAEFRTALRKAMKNLDTQYKMMGK